MGQVFISYRRDDARALAERISGSLVQAFGREAVFKDVDSIRSGEDFEIRLQAALSEAKIFLAIIGPAWLGITDENGRRRLDDPADYVRREIEMALDRECAIIPLTVANARIPAEDEVPQSLQKFTKRNALEIRYDPDFNHDMQKLVDRICELGLPLARPAGVAVQEIPPPPTDFVDRDAELKSLLEVVHEGRKRIMAIRAIGGMGKTAFARRVAQALSAQFPLQLYHPMRGSSSDPAPPDEALAELILSLDPDCKLPASSTALSKLYLSMLRGKSALILLDDVAEPGTVERLVPPPDCLLLYTSRRRFVLPGQYSVDLDRLPLSASVRLLGDICDRIGEAGAALADLCGNLPFALRLAAGALAEESFLSTSDFMEYLRSDRLRQLEGAQLILTACLERLPPESCKRLSMLSVFTGPFTKEAAGTVWDLDNSGAVRQLTQLMEFCFLDWTPSLERFSMHDLLREHLLRQLDPELGRIARARHAKYVLGAVRESHRRFAANQAAFSAVLAGLDPLWPELRAAFAYLNSSADPGPETDRLCSAMASESFLFLEARESADVQLAWANAGLQAAERAGLAEDLHIHLRHVAWLIRFVEPEKARNMLDRALELCRRLRLAPDEGKVVGFLGVVAQIQGRLDDAGRLYEDSLELARRSRDKRAEAIALGRIADVHKARGEYSRGVALLSEAVRLDQETRDERGEAIDLASLTEALRRCADNEKAWACTLRRIEIWRKLKQQGEEWRAVVEALAVGGVLKKDEGLPALRKRAAELVLQDDLGEIAKSHAMAMGLAAYHDGDGTLALALFRKALESAREAGDRRKEGNALGNLGCAYALLGEHKTAVHYHEQAIAIDRELGDLAGEAMGSWDLGETYAQMGEYKKAAELMRVRIAFVRAKNESAANELEALVGAIEAKAAP